MAILAQQMTSPCAALVATLGQDGKIVVTDGSSSFVPAAKNWSGAVDQWRSLIGQAAAKHGVPEAIIAAVMHSESGGNPGSSSSAGAIGLMQLMPETFNALAGRKPGTAVDRQEAARPEINIDLGTKLLSQLLAKYKGDLVRTAASYNAGPRAVTDPRCGDCKCYAKSGVCDPDPWGMKTDCAYVGHVLGAYNTATARGYDWHQPAKPSALAGSSSWPWLMLGAFGVVTGVVIAIVATRR